MDNQEENRGGASVVRNFLWRFAERVGAQGVTLLVGLVLARLLSPEDYGLIAIVTVFITVLNVFVDSGFGNALIQKKDADDLDFSSVFWFNVGLCLLLYGVLFLASPAIAAFYKKDVLSPVLRVLGLQVVISGVKNVQQAFVSRTMQFKRFFFATLGGTLGAAALGIILAKHGFGVWALVAQQLFNTLVDTVILWLTVRWRPKFAFSFARLRQLFSYGWKLLVSALIDTLYTEIRQLIIGKIYTSEDLAFYNWGYKLPNFFVSNVNTAIDSVLLPTMSKAQDDRQTVRAMTRRAIKTSTYVMAPIMMGLIFVGEPLIRLVLTEKWLPCVPFMRIFCVTFLFYPIHTANLNAIKAMGRSDLYLKLEIVKKVLGTVALLSTMFISIEAMAYSMLVTSVLNQIVNSWPNKKLLDYAYPDQLRDILPGILLAAVMGAAVYCVRFIGLSDVLTLLIQIPLGALIYWAGSRLFRLEAYGYLLETAKPILKKLLHRG